MSGHAQNTQLIKTMNRNVSFQPFPGLNSTLLTKILLAAIIDKISLKWIITSLFFFSHNVQTGIPDW